MLGTVSGDAGDPIKVKQQVHSVTNLLRMSLENAERTAISLTEELDMVKSYVELQRGRIPQPFTAEFHVAENVEQSMLIPSMMVQIPVENAIKHGLMPFDGEKKLSVLIEKKDEAIVIAIEDNGVGREKSKGRTAGTGTGLKVLLQTIVLLNQRNKEKISFRISDRDPSGTVVQISIPLNYSYQLQS
jgi:LytS/YehU family sensor histidine kinase